MPQRSGYVLARVNGDRYRLDSTDRTKPEAIAFIIRVRDRFGIPIGWKLKPLFVMQGSKSRTWPTAAEPLASTKLMTPGQARTAVKQADATEASSAGSAP